MNLPALVRQGRRLLQVGVVLLLFTSFEGLAIPHLASPRVGLSARTLAALQSVILIALGLLWPKLNLAANSSRAAFWLLVFSTLAILVAYVLAASWGVGLETIALAGEFPHGLVQGSSVQEISIKILAYSSAPTGLVSFALILWGLRGASITQKLRLKTRRCLCSSAFHVRALGETRHKCSSELPSTCPYFAVAIGRRT
jgi:hydroxylaminobenzene mutase